MTGDMARYLSIARKLYTVDKRELSMVSLPNRAYPRVGKIQDPSTS